MKRHLLTLYTRTPLHVGSGTSVDVVDLPIMRERISDETGTAAGGALFNQENVPSETLFCSILDAFDERTAQKAKAKEERRNAEAALTAFRQKIEAENVFQFGGDASTGLGYCTVRLVPPTASS